jgi:hypothetical protein
MPQSAKRTATGVGKIEPNSKKYLSYFSPRQLRRLELISGSYLQELGYDVEYEAGSRDIGALRQRLIRGTDFVRSNTRLRNKLTGKQDISWGYVFQGILASLREYSSKKY